MLVIEPSVVRIAGGWIMTCFFQLNLRTHDVAAARGLQERGLGDRSL